MKTDIITWNFVIYLSYEYNSVLRVLPTSVVIFFQFEHIDLLNKIWYILSALTESELQPA